MTTETETTDRVFTTTVSQPTGEGFRVETVKLEISQLDEDEYGYSSYAAFSATLSAPLTYAVVSGYHMYAFQAVEDITDRMGNVWPQEVFDWVTGIAQGLKEQEATMRVPEPVVVETYGTRAVAVWHHGNSCCFWTEDTAEPGTPCQGETGNCGYHVAVEVKDGYTALGEPIWRPPRKGHEWQIAARALARQVTGASGLGDVRITTG